MSETRHVLLLLLLLLKNTMWKWDKFSILVIKCFGKFSPQMNDDLDSLVPSGYSATHVQ